jgi:outer membrane protein TolC
LTALLLALIAGGQSPTSAQMPGSSSVQGQPRTLSLEAALQVAEEQNPLLQRAREQVRSAEAAVWGAAGRMLPTVSVSSLWNFAEKVQIINFPDPLTGQQTEFEIDFTQDYQGTVNVALPVWSWGANRAGLRDSQAGVDVASIFLEGDRQEVLLQVTQVFYGVLLAEEALTVAGDALAQAERQEAIASERVSRGAASEFDYLRARVQVANLRPSVTRAETALRQARIGLNLLMGLPSEDEVRLSGELTYTPAHFDLVELKQESLINRAEIRTARLNARRAELAVTVARATRLPNLSIGGTYFFRANDAAFSDRFNDNYTANLMLAIPLFDGFASRTRTAQARAGLNMAEIVVNQTERSVEAEVEQAYRDLLAAGQSHLAQIDNVAQAERAMEIAQVSYENEMMTSVELMDSQLALTMARQNHFQSLYDYQIALARIRKAVGRPIGG